MSTADWIWQTLFVIAFTVGGIGLPILWAHQVDESVRRKAARRDSEEDEEDGPWH